MADNLFSLVQKLLLKNNISFEKKELSFQIQSHPSYPSLHSVTGVLDHFDIENVAANVPVNAETLLQLPDCFIGQINTKLGLILVFIERKKANYTIYYSSNENEQITEGEFLEKFTGIIVAVEKNENQKTTSVEGALTSNIFLISSLILLGIVFVLSKPTIISSAYFLLSIVGTIISVSILNQELGVQNVIGNAFCASTGEKKDCDAVLDSEGATVYKNYKLSDLSFIYFLGLSVSTFLMSIKNIGFELVYFISLLALPITIFSIYYQYKVVKKWCLLCLSIVMVLWLQASALLLNTEIISFYSVDSLLYTAFSFSLVFAIFGYLKPKYIEMINGNKIKIDALKFKRNYSLFSTLLNTSSKINTDLKEIPEIVFGNSQSELEILIVTHPFCSYCKPVHKMIENILQKYKDEVRVVVRFNLSDMNKESDGIKIAGRLLELFETEQINICLKAMSEIYEGKLAVKWLKKWGECTEKGKYNTYLEKENLWCTDNGINFTPEILINGKSFPKEYDRADLVYFIEDLHEDYCPIEPKNINNHLELSI